jgi:hypothetical protein
MKRNLFYLILITALFAACDKSGELSSGGTLKVTASTGTTKTLSNYKQALESGCWYSMIDEPTSTENYYWLDMGGFVDVGDIDISFSIPRIQTGMVYSYFKNGGGTTGVDIQFNDWIDSDYTNMTKATIEFSKFQYPGRIAGVVINYDKAGKVLSRAVFDFISTKSAI